MTVSPLARSTDPATSHNAARLVDKMKAADIQEEILRIVSARVFRDKVLEGSSAPLVGFTDEELVEGLVPGSVSPSGVRTRRNELVRGGWLRDSGYRRRTRSGREAIIWTLT